MILYSLHHAIIHILITYVIILQNNARYKYLYTQPRYVATTAAVWCDEPLHISICEGRPADDRGGSIVSDIPCAVLQKQLADMSI